MLSLSLYIYIYIYKPPKVTNEPITKILSNQFDLKLGQFTQKELDLVLRKIKNRKAARLDESTPRRIKDKEIR